MAGEQPLALLRREQLRDRRRNEPGEFRPLPLDRLEQARVRDRDRGLIGKGLDELDVVVGEETRGVAASTSAIWSGSRESATRPMTVVRSRACGCSAEYR
jgi:hypothetical protein